MQKKAEKQTVLALIGPTASGKTSLAISLAEQFNGEIISADSRQVYRGLDIGTDKVRDDQMCDIAHHCIDIANPHEVFTAADFKACGTAALQTIWDNDHIPIIAGGTGFYVDTLLERISFPEVPPNETLRTELAEKTVTELYEMLKSRAPERAKTIDAENPRRLIRALEIHAGLGYIPSMEEKTSPYSVCWIGIDRTDAEYETRIPERAEKWLSDGFLSEVSALEEKHIPEARWSEFGFEYELGRQLLHGDISEPIFYKAFLEKNMQYIKRQRKYFKRNPDIKWFHPENTADIFAYIRNCTQ